MNARYLAKTLGDESTIVFLDFSVLVHFPLEDESCAEYGFVVRSIDGRPDPTGELFFHLSLKKLRATAAKASEEGDCLVPQNTERAFGDSVVLRCMRRRLFVFDA